MLFRLLIDLEVLELIQKLSPARRRKFFDQLRRIQQFPGHYSDFIHPDDKGRRLDVSLCDGLAIFYWTDAADQHVKILKITAAP